MATSSKSISARRSWPITCRLADTGRGSAVVPEAMEVGRDHRQVAERHFIRKCSIEKPFSESFSACESKEVDRRSRTLAGCRVRSNSPLWVTTVASHSVPTAIASFAPTPESFEETIGNVILLGGGTDTLAAMAGALSGAYLDVARLPSKLVGLLESSRKGGSLPEGAFGKVVGYLPSVSRLSGELKLKSVSTNSSAGSHLGPLPQAAGRGSSLVLPVAAFVAPAAVAAVFADTL